MSDYVLKHHGIKGQKWGVRRFQNPDGTRTEAGKARQRSKSIRVLSSPKSKVECHEQPKSATANFLARFSKKARENQKAYQDYKILDKNGVKVGTISTFIEKDGTTLNGVWTDIKTKQRGKGYSQDALNLIKNDAKDRGFKRITLECPGNSPDARHIYEKMGFKAVKQLTTPEEDFIWGGLTAMELDLTK